MVSCSKKKAQCVRDREAGLLIPNIEEGKQQSGQSAKHFARSAAFPLQKDVVAGTGFEPATSGL